MRYACEDLETLRKGLDKLDGEVAGTLQQHQVGQLLTTIGGIGDTTAAMFIAELGDPARFESAGVLAAYVGVCPAHKHAGKHQPRSSSLSPVGNRGYGMLYGCRTLTAATQSNPWLMAFYRRLIERGKPHKVALCAAMRKLLAAIYSVAKHRRPFGTNLNPQSAVRVRYENA